MPPKPQQYPQKIEVSKITQKLAIKYQAPGVTLNKRILSQIKTFYL